MKTAIVYFSLDGNCRFVAHRIAEELGEETDIISLEPVKAYPQKGFMKMLKGGFSAMRKDKPAIMPLNFDPREYDQIILGTPVWAGTFAPPIRTFFLNNYILDKPISIYACSSSGNAESAFKKLREALDGCEILDNQLSLLDPFTKPNDDNTKKIKEFALNLK